MRKWFYILDPLFEKSLAWSYLFPDVPRAMLPPPHDDGAERNGRRSSGNPLRDFMLKSGADGPQGPGSGSSREPRVGGHHPSHEFPSSGSPFYGWTPFSKVSCYFPFPFQSFYT